jgi:2-polyprenyl-6-hydroxyphenyl methylase/3-demethylubiquinone-9 3-methyltransferase
MTIAHDRYVIGRFNALEGRFRADVESDDYRLLGVLDALGDVRGLRVLDIGCGKGRFARHLESAGAEVVALDPSSAMIGHASGLRRLRASASRLPFASGSFDRIIAIEVLEHLSPPGCDAAIAEVRRVLRPGGRVAIIDKNALAIDADRPWLPRIAIKKLDERRGLWMYPSDSPARERWFRPGALARRLRRHFDNAQTRFLLSPGESRRAIFRLVPRSRLMVLWTARAPGGER